LGLSTQDVHADPDLRLSQIGRRPKMTPIALNDSRSVLHLDGEEMRIAERQPQHGGQIGRFGTRAEQPHFRHGPLTSPALPPSKARRQPSQRAAGGPDYRQNPPASPPPARGNS